MREVDTILEQLRPKLTEMEAWRQQRRAAGAKGTWIGAGIGALGLLVILIFPPVGIAIAIGGLIIILVVRLTNQGKFKKRFKQEIFPIVIDIVKPGVLYRSEQYIAESIYHSSRIFLQDVDRYKGEDYFSGTVGQTKIEFSEIHAEDRQVRVDSKGRTRTEYVTVFKGLFFVTEFHKHFKGETYVLPDLTESWLGSFGRKLQKWNWSRPDLVELENSEFEKLFSVYGTDQVESRYLLTPKMMELIMELRSKFNCTTHMSFLNDKFYIALSSNHDFFELKFSESLLNSKGLEQIVFELQACFNIVEDLQLNTRIWSKD
jgi:hypothetical protein